MPECGTTISLIKVILTWTILVSSILAVVAGIVAVVRRSGGLAWVMTGVVGGAVVLTTTLLTGSGCSSSAA